MKRVLNPELDRIVLDALAARYRLNEKREGIHLSTLNYCLTKGYFDHELPLLPTDTEVLLFATGYGLQELMFPSTSEEIYEEDGITYRPDGVLHLKELGLIEIKSTRSGTKRYQEGDLPDTWITYMKGGCHMMKTVTYNLSVIYLAERPSAKVISEKITFTPEEIEENWNWLLERRDLYRTALETKILPRPYTTAPKWMCDNCRYSAMCQAFMFMEEKK